MLNEKNCTRKLLHKRLFSLCNETRKLASLAACHFLIEQLTHSSFKVLSFASKPFEINLWPLNRFLAKEKRLLLPRVNTDQLEIYEVNDLNHLRLSSFGIQEPSPSSCLLTQDPGLLILVPGLGFTDEYIRIGHGKGFYDKFLKKFPQISKWGVGFQEQKCITIPIEEHDVSLDKVFFF